MIIPGSANASLLAMGANIDLVVSANVLNYNLKAAAIAAGWDGISKLTCKCTINSGVVVGSASASNFSFDTDNSYPPGSELSLVINGLIVGHGGNGGNGWNTGAGNGSNGGPALRAQYPIKIINNGLIGGGGGGGGGTGNRDVSCGGSGGAGWNSGSAGLGFSAAHNNGNGNIGGTTTGGAASITEYSWQQAYGGAGGGLGASGSTGYCNVDFSYYGSPGSGGSCTDGNSLITWVVTGARYGALN